MAIQLCKIEERHKLNKDTHIINQKYGKSFVFYSGWKRKANQVSFNTRIVVLEANVCGKSRLQIRRTILADNYMNHVPNWRQHIKFLFGANRKAKPNIVWMWDSNFPFSCGKQRGTWPEDYVIRTELRRALVF